MKLRILKKKKEAAERIATYRWLPAPAVEVGKEKHTLEAVPVLITRAK